ncbi:MAG: LPS export ABC transporter periplasmic protein LptC [Candidatus Tectomicrobia bacterium RIFCSPLOWO2_12_FULL_69_37]|nr:MAG: LPS export ABC transporter periplasmic protein LptC [Candidatus Tectomicrobia bacterium RIFCSPLOWO2_12_FULL_69_37]
MFMRGLKFPMRSWRALRWSLLAAVILLGGTMAFFLIRTSGPQFDAGGISVLGTDADLRIDKAHMVQNHKGRMDWEMWADTALVYRKKDETHLQTLRMRLYSREGKPTDVTAERGVMGNQSRNVTLTGNVLIRTSDGITMRTDSLHYNPKEHRVLTDSPIVLQGQTFRLTGVGLNGNTEEGRYVLREKVRATIAGAGDRPPGEPAPPQPAAGGKAP